MKESNSVSSVIDEVVRVEQRWAQAHRELDPAAIEEILADDYVQIQADGTVIGKAETVQSYRSGKRRWDYANSDEHRVSVYGDIAILLGRWTGRGENDGARFDYTARFMAIYIRRSGTWQLRAEQSTSISDDAE
jgi:ketosteroid isomerase-like protein